MAANTLGTLSMIDNVGGRAERAMGRRDEFDTSLKSFTPVGHVTVGYL